MSAMAARKDTLPCTGRILSSVHPAGRMSQTAYLTSLTRRSEASCTTQPGAVLGGGGGEDDKLRTGASSLVVRAGQAKVPGRIGQHGCTGNCLHLDARPISMGQACIGLGLYTLPN
jgi:hypothetical protein